MNDTPTHPDATVFDTDGVGYDPLTQTFHARFDDEVGGLTVTIVETIGAVTDRDPVSLAPLFETIDPEALAALVSPADAKPLEVTFAYEGCQVTVSSEGSVIVEPSEI
jgi:hypothetical protein